MPLTTIKFTKVNVLSVATTGVATIFNSRLRLLNGAGRGDGHQGQGDGRNRELHRANIFRCSLGETGAQLDVTPLKLSEWARNRTPFYT
jgi:hypothetical protein